ncbi:hypothetical protein TRIP_B200069 [uncultured Desulfatiglans sp.]|nr:hypothetical protein TRIP_B200069 [uncultured Desulfatiglans sp.]
MNEKMRAMAWYRAREDQIADFAEIESLLPFTLLDYINTALAGDMEHAGQIHAAMMEAKSNIAAAQPR